jgi:hypothetical protein
MVLCRSGKLEQDSNVAGDCQENGETRASTHAPTLEELPGPTARVLSPRTTHGRPRESNPRRAAAAPPGSAAGHLRHRPAAGA